MDRRGAGATVQVVPHRPGWDSVRLWVHTGRAGAPAWLCVVDDDGTEVARRAGPVLEVDADVPQAEDPPGCTFAGIHVWDVTGLAAGTSYRVEDDRATPLATFRTLPERLPFTLAVGSCYSVDDDHASPPGQAPPAPYRLPRLHRLRRRWMALRSATFPRRRDEDDPGGVAVRHGALARDLARSGRPIDLTLLLGDQVYVDQPPRDYLWPLDARRSWARVASRYRATWRRLGPLLACGAHVCVSEDHEYWNNYPRRAAWLAFWSDAKLAALKHAADRHRAVYQQTPSMRPLRIGSGPPVHFFVADTRCRRTVAREDGGTFMDEAAFEELVAWIGALDGPGVLVLGQPLLAAQGNPWKDTTLANYPAQHTPLCEAISGAAHDVVVLCGDVHYGRRAVVPLASGRCLVEVVSSPTALLGSAGSVPVDAAAPPSLAVAGDVRSEFLRRDRPDGVGEDHVTVLTFAAAPDGGVSMDVAPYYTRFSDDDGVPRRAADWVPINLR